MSMKYMTLSDLFLTTVFFLKQTLRILRPCRCAGRRIRLFSLSIHTVLRRLPVVLHQSLFPGQSTQTFALFLNVEQTAVRFKRAVSFVCKHFLCEFLSELYAFLIEAVYVPDKSLKHHFIFV